MRRIAAHLSERYRPSTLDLRGHGRSRGVFRFGRDEWEDLGVALDHLHREDRAPLAVLGFSMGGSLAITAIGRERERFPSVVSVVSVAAPVDPAAVVPRFWRASALLQLRPSEVWRVPRFVPPYLVRDRPDPREAAPGLSPVPLLVLHGKGDWLVPDADAVALHSAAREPRELRILEGRFGFHADGLLRSRRARLLEVLDGWLEATFRTASAQEDSP
jgi:alpha-beta hydrolase superfamily lysophospholipase